MLIRSASRTNPCFHTGARKDYQQQRFFSEDATAHSVLRTRTLCHADLKDTITILKPHWRHLSPCWGAVLAVSPVIGNMMRFSQHQNKEREGSGVPLLASKLFWQADRFSPLQVSRNKSHPVAHLTPSFMGILWQAAAGLSSENEQKMVLQQAGIKSNHVHNQWTGVSMARWMDLLSSLHHHNTSLASQFTPLIVAPWLAALWQIARTKEDLLEFVLALENFGAEQVLDDTQELSQALKHDENARKQWAASSFTVEEMTPDHVAAALDELVSLEHTSSTHGARLMELISASRAIQHVAKPVVPNGRYGYDGGSVKSDCVEVAVREVIDLLLWDESQGCFDLSRLPRPSKELVQLYDLDRQVTDYGQLWFNVLSNRPGCDYLAISPQGKPYELTPTIANIAKLVQQLLGFDAKTESEWTTLEELVSTWNAQANIPLLKVSSFKRSFRPPMSDQLVHEEHSTLCMEGSRYGISVKLDRKREFATVTHIRMRNDRIEEGLLAKVRQVALRKPKDVSLVLLCMAIMGDYGLYQTATQHQIASSNNKAVSESLLMDLFAAPFGPDRRDLMELAGTSDLEVEDRAHAQALRMSRNALAEAVVRVCGELRQEDSLREVLLAWLLQESPYVVTEHVNNHLSYDPRVENELMKLPLTVLDKLPLPRSPWACRDGAALAQVVQYRLRLVSSRNLVFQDIHGNSSSLGQLITKLLFYLKL